MSNADFQAAHKTADTDFERDSIHHSLGDSEYQAAPGNHKHDKDYEPLGGYDTDIAALDGRLDTIEYDKNLRVTGYRAITKQSIPYNVATKILFESKYDPAGVLDLSGGPAAATSGNINLPPGSYLASAVFSLENTVAGTVECTLVAAGVRSKTVFRGNLVDPNGTAAVGGTILFNSGVPFTIYMSIYQVITASVAKLTAVGAFACELTVIKLG